MKVFPVLAWFLAAAASLCAADAPRLFAGATPLEWSERLAQSEMKRLGNTLEAGATPTSRWDYAPSVFALSVVRLGELQKNDTYIQYGTRAVASHVSSEGAIAGLRIEEYNIDSITPGKVLLAALDRGVKNDAYVKAVQTLRGQMAAQPRTSEGGFWHKQRYPSQMWLDGLYMASPFLSQYAQRFNEPALFDDVAKQILLTDRHLYDPATGLYKHAWDEARVQTWADKQTGLSPNFWTRSIGWYGMAIDDVLDTMPVTQSGIDGIVAALRRVADGAVKWQDPQSGVWWQVTDQGTRAGNYLEASGSSMLVYTLAKAVNQGYLPRDKYLPAILKGYEGLVREFIKTNPDGTIRLTKVCSVAGLGYTNAAGKPRNGSFEYYISEPVVDNDPKGTGPFILAGLEVDRLLSTTNAPVAPRFTDWSSVPGILARIKAPEFPAREFNITAYGARPGADVTAAIKAAIEACSAAGGGRVVIPVGEWLTGAIQLKSNVNLHVSRGATLKFSTNPKDYPIVYTRFEGVECMNYSPFVYAYEQHDIAITGEGTLDGQAAPDNWWRWRAGTAGEVTLQTAARNRLLALSEQSVPVADRTMGDGSYLRPNFIQPYRCENVLIEGVTILHPPMWSLHPVLSRNVTIRGVTVESRGPNGDGCDPESCRDVLIEKCVFDTSDDCIALKSGRNNDGRRVNVPTENVVIRDCVMKDGHGGVSLGSECSGGIRNIFVENCTMDSPRLDRALRFKSNATRGGILENVFMRNVKVGRVAEAILTIDLLYEEGAKGGFQPVVRNVQLDNIRSSASPRVLYIRGFEGAVVDGIRINNSTFEGVTETEVVSFAGAISFQNVTITPARAFRSANSVSAPTTP